MSSPVRPVALRDARPGDVPGLAQLWWSGWQDAHAGILPIELARFRTLESFRERLEVGLHTARIADAGDDLLGFFMITDDELYQFYVAAPARGTGVAHALMEDALGRFRENGVKAAWLACAIGNDRAARFYEKCGWTRIGVMTSRLPTPEGVFSLDCWRYERTV